jgi:hypothetical protein
VSVLEQFRDAEQRVAKRLKELEPMVAEYRELETLAQRLGIDGRTSTKAGSGGAPARAGRRASRAPAKPPGGGGKTTAATKRARPRARRGAAGERDQQVLDLVRQRPGITVAEAGQTLGVDPTGLYRVVHRLEQRGELRKSGRSLEPIGAGSSS